MLSFPQPNARRSAVLVDELDAGQLKRRSNRKSRLTSYGAESYRFFSAALAVLPRTACPAKVGFNAWAGSTECAASASCSRSIVDCLAIDDAWRGYFRFGCPRFRSRRPSPPPFSSMNSIPARSKAARIASTAPRETSRRSFSKSTIVESPRSAACASCDCVIPSSPRAARHWAGVIGSTFFVDMPSVISYQYFLLMTGQSRQAQ